MATEKSQQFFELLGQLITAITNGDDTTALESQISALEESLTPAESYDFALEMIAGFSDDTPENIDRETAAECGSDVLEVKLAYVKGQCSVLSGLIAQTNERIAKLDDMDAHRAYVRARLHGIGGPAPRA